MFVCVFPGEPSAALVQGLIEAGYQPVPIAGLEAVERSRPPDGWVAAVVELRDQPHLALTVARKLGAENSLSVLVVADRTHTADLVTESDYDDFILTPLDRTELRVRLGKLAETTESAPLAQTDLVEFRDLTLNTATYQATIGGAPIDLTYMEYELLRFFTTNAGRAWSREQILSKVWGYDYFGGSRTVDVHVRRLRAKLGEERSAWITTVRSVGYRFG